MIYLLGSILFSSYLTLSFKVLERFRIPLFPSIVFNYITCVITGLVIQGPLPAAGAVMEESWLKWALLMGVFYIVLFNLIGLTTQKIGVAVSSVANKLSLVIPFAFSLYLYNESATWVKIAGIVVAVVAVIFTCLPPAHNQAFTQKKQSSRLLFLLPAILFLGSGLLDALLNHVQQTHLNSSNSNNFLVLSFGTAGFIGSIILAFSVLIQKQKFDTRSIVAGIAIGVPNYFSIWCLVRVLEQYAGNSSAVIPINNMGIVLFSSVVAALLFSEKLSGTNWLGIILSLAAVALIAFG